MIPEDRARSVPQSLARNRPVTETTGTLPNIPASARVARDDPASKTNGAATVEDVVDLVAAQPQPRHPCALVFARARPIEYLVKAILDYVLAALALLSLLPIFLLIALAIRVDSRGQIMFRQRRCGQSQRVFEMYKFRSMTVIEDGPVIRQAQWNDERVTRVGRFLRRRSLDELPQLINVLRGEMSLVGPRPHALAHNEHFSRQIPGFSRRHQVRPGMTGWAQVHGLRGEIKTPDALRQRVEHDLFYIDHWSLWLDIKILARTLLVICIGPSAY